MGVSENTVVVEKPILHVKERKFTEGAEETGLLDIT